MLSGTASDGTDGLQAIKEANGITFAQEPASAKFCGMPQSAVDAGVVDYCLPIPALAKELVRISQHPYVIASESKPSIRDAATLEQIIALVRAAVRVDFGEYKSPTFERRLARRMALRRVDTIDAYLHLLRQAPDEVWALFEDTLIHVTSFFRDPEVFENLKTSVLPAIVKGRPEGAPLRVWVPGCATGEEVYSLGIALAEFLGESSRPDPDLRIRRERQGHRDGPRGVLPRGGAAPRRRGAGAGATSRRSIAATGSSRASGSCASSCSTISRETRRSRRSIW